MEVSYLADHPEFVVDIAKWHHEEWGWFTPGLTLEDRRERLQRQLSRESLPVVFVAHESERPLGTASLRVTDVDTRPELTPWLGGVFVAIDQRRRGVGTMLVHAVETEAARRGFRQLYLFTFDKALYYEKLGWDSLEETEYRGKHIVIMHKEPCLWRQ